MKHPSNARYLALACVLPLLFGCGSLTGPDGPRVELRTDREVYAVGEAGTLTVVNRQLATIEIPHGLPGLCGIYGVERREGEDWVEVGWSGICVAVLSHLRLRPGESTQIEFFVLDDWFQPGNEYRLGLSVRDRSSGPYTVMTSAGFLVEE